MRILQPLARIAGLRARILPPFLWARKRLRGGPRNFPIFALALRSRHILERVCRANFTCRPRAGRGFSSGALGALFRVLKIANRGGVRESRLARQCGEACGCACRASKNLAKNFALARRLCPKNCAALSPYFKGPASTGPPPPKTRPCGAPKAEFSLTFCFESATVRV